MRAAAIRCHPARARERDGLALVEIPGDHHRMHVRRAADRRRVAKLRRHEPHGERDVPLRFAVRPRRAELGKHGGRTQRRAPRAKVLRAVSSSSSPEIRVHVERGERSPPGAAPVREDPRSRRAELACDETDETAIGDHLPLPDLALAPILELRGACRDGHVRLAQRRNAERSVLAEIALPAHSAERLTDQSQHGCRDDVDIERGRPCRGSSVALHDLTKSRQLLRKLAHAMMLAQLASLDRAFVVAILLAPARVESPCLNRRARRVGDVHVAPRRRNAQRRDTRQRATITNQATIRVAILEPVSRPGPTNPRGHAAVPRKARALCPGA